MSKSKYRRSAVPTPYVATCLKILNAKSNLTVGKEYVVWFYNHFVEPFWIEIEDDQGYFRQYKVKGWFEVRKQ